MKYNQPFDQPSAPNAPYVDGNPSAGIQGSIVPAAAIEYPQREIMNIITAAALSGTNADLTQLLQALKIVDVCNHFKYSTNGGNAAQWSASIPSLPIMPPPAGTAIWFKPGFASVKGGTVFSVNGSPFQNVTNPNLQPVDLGDVVPGSVLLLFFDGTEWLILAGKPGNTSGGNATSGSIPSLQANANWYVNGTTGDDSNYDGTSATVVSAKVGPFKTLQRAANEVLKYNMNGYNQYVHVADGNYANVQLSMTNGAGTVYFIGNETNPGNVSVSGSGTGACAFFIVGGTYWIDGFRVSTSGAGALDGIGLNNPGTIVTLSNIRFGPATRFQLGVGFESRCSLTDSVTGFQIESGATAIAHQASTLNASIAPDTYNFPKMNILGSCTFSNGYAYASHLGICQVKYSSLTGKANCHGPMYDVFANAVIDVFGQGASYLPGDAAGTTATGGQFIYT